MLAALSLLLAAPTNVRAENFSAQEVHLLLAAAAPGLAGPADRTLKDPLLVKLDRVDREDPAWPLYAFLKAEALLHAKRTTPAADGYRSLIEQAASDPYHDTWGGNGLVAVALYRWLQLRARSGSNDPAAFDIVSESADALMDRRLVRSAFRQYAILSSMPLLEEELYYALAQEAMRVGRLKKAGTYYLNYLSRLRSYRPLPESEALYQLILDQGISTPARIALIRGKRLVSLSTKASKRAALPYLKTASHSEHDQTRLEAQYLLARASGEGMTRAERTAIYQEVHEYASNDALAQSALLYKGLQYGPEQPEFKSILTQLVRQYPSGPSTNEALKWLATGARLTGDLDGAVASFETLRQLHGESLDLGRVAIDTALGLVWRGQLKDFEVATGILTEFIAQQPNSRDRPRAQFWLGRIAEEQDNEAEAKRRFVEASQADWFGYYGLRSRMHLADGRGARRQLLIDNQTLAGEIRSAYADQAKAVSQPATEDGIYRRRLQTALSNGLYGLALESEDELRRANASKRLQDFTLEELDALGFVAPIAVMMALRQDALAAADSDPSVPIRVALARQLGDSVADWPVVLSLVHPASIRSALKCAELMRASGYLRTAYPMVFGEPVQKAVSEFHVSPAILYAIMRHESFFYPAALSSAGALGLFQFVPKTFNWLDDKWHLLRESGAADRAAYLMNAQLSISLGARWFAKEMLPTFDDNFFFAILAHHSGTGRVKKWRSVWRERKWTDDVEMMIESFRMHDFRPEKSESYGIEARSFARHVITDMAIVTAVDLYGKNLAHGGS